MSTCAFYGSWDCPQCKYNNLPNEQWCQKCGTTRPHNLSPQKPNSKSRARRPQEIIPRIFDYQTIATTNLYEKWINTETAATIFGLSICHIVGNKNWITINSNDFAQYMVRFIYGRLYEIQLGDFPYYPCVGLIIFKHLEGVMKIWLEYTTMGYVLSANDIASYLNSKDNRAFIFILRDQKFSAITTVNVKFNKIRLYDGNVVDINNHIIGIYGIQVTKVGENDDNILVSGLGVPIQYKNHNVIDPECRDELSDKQFQFLKKMINASYSQEIMQYTMNNNDIYDTKK
eukprot:96301_1